MYQLHFHLSDRPFASVANPEHYFPASSVEQAREVTALNIERASGTTMLVGAVGTGKSLLCQLIANQFSNELPVCTIESGQIRNAEELLQAVLHGLDLPHHGDLSELRITLSNHITGQSCLNGVLLIVDEAERLSIELLEEIRVLTNLVKDGQPCVRLLLAGAESLEEKLASPALESLNQRVVGRLYLDNFSQDETRDYICARINAAGGDATSIFSDDAFQTVYQATNGVPRLVNQLCDHTLLLASVASHSRVDGARVEEAWADLHQLPMTNKAVQEMPQAASEVVVEFGSLEDDDAAESGSQVNGLQAVVDVMDDSPGSVEIHFGDDLEVVDNQPQAIEINDEADAQIVINDFEEQESDVEQVVVAFDDEPQHDGETEDDVDRHSPFADEGADTSEQAEREDEDSPAEEFADESVGEAAPMEELTMEQATNPFGEQFGADAKISYEVQSESEDATESAREDEYEEPDAHVDVQANGAESQEEADLDERVVIQDFGSPSQFAREDREDVTSNYSENLAEQLSASQPALRMHDASEAQEDAEDSSEQGSVGDQEASEFAPLSSYTSDENEFDEARFDEANEEQYEEANEEPAIVIAMQDDEVAEEQQQDAGEVQEYELESESTDPNDGYASEEQVGEFDGSEVGEDARDAAQIDETLDGIEQDLEQAQRDQSEEVTAEGESDGSFDPKADPVMPEEGVESMISDMSTSMGESARISESAGFVAQAATSFRAPVAVAEPTERVEEEVVVETQVESSSEHIEQETVTGEQRAKSKKLFKTLFSSLRSN